MKKNLTLVLCAIALYGCSEQNLSRPDKESVALELSSRSGSLVNKADNTDPVMAAGVTVGVYVPSKGGTPTTAANGFANVSFTSDASGSLQGSTVSLVVGESYDVYGYSPYVTSVGDPAAVGFNHSDDVLWSTKATIDNASSLNRSAQLAFSHMVSQVSFNVVVDASFSGSQTITDESTIKVTGFSPTATLNVQDGVLTPVTPDATTEITATGTADGKLNTVPTCFFVPQSGSMTLNIQVKHDNITMNTTTTKTFVAGESYSYNVKIVDADLGITATLTDWVVVPQEDLPIQK